MAADGIWTPIFVAAIFILPAWIANLSFTLVGVVVKRFGLWDAPLDKGLKLWDGRPLLGTHVTIWGLVDSFIAGTVVGVMQGRPMAGFLMGIGAYAGNALGSFLKRRVAMKEGRFFPVLDHIDYLIGAIPLAMLIEPASMMTIALAIALTLVLHPLACVVGYLLKFKSEPL
ncbi:MAG: CDP-archaeol synthase [archaeon]